MGQMPWWKCQNSNATFWVVFKHYGHYLNHQLKLNISVLVVCAIRLDFDTFSILGPSGTAEQDATQQACQDSFTVIVRLIYDFHTPC